MSDHKMQVIIKSYDTTKLRTNVSAEEGRALIKSLKKKKKSKWVTFKNLGKINNRKTLYVRVYNSTTDHIIGRIVWFRNWRQYIFEPNFDTVFNSECLTDISSEVKRMNSEHREQLKVEKLKGAADAEN